MVSYPNIQVTGQSARLQRAGGRPQARPQGAAGEGAAQHFGSSDWNRCSVSILPKSSWIVGHTHATGTRQRPSLLERSPGTKWRQKWNKNEVPTSHTPTRSNTPTTVMQVNGTPNTSMRVLWWGNGLKSTKYNRSSSSPNLTTLGKGSRKKRLQF